MFSIQHSLTPGENYYYVFGDSYGWSKEYSFFAAPYPGSKNPITVIAYGGESSIYATSCYRVT